MNESETLYKVADYITTHGWTRGGSGWDWEGGGPVCIEGAFLAVLGLKNRGGFSVILPNGHGGTVELSLNSDPHPADLGLIRSLPAYVALRTYVNENRTDAEPVAYSALFSWNDASFTVTKEKVICSLLSVAKMMEPEKVEEEATEEETAPKKIKTRWNWRHLRLETIDPIDDEYAALCEKDTVSTG